MNEQNITSLFTNKIKHAEKITDIEFIKNNFIDFSYGGPDESLFPVDLIRNGALVSISNNSGLLYSPDRGASSLILSLMKWLPAFLGFKADYENFLITNGAQDAISIIADSLIEEGDIVITESPTYWRAKSIFVNLGAKIIYAPIVGNDLDIDWVENFLKKNQLNNQRVKLFYTIPTHQNPTGSIMSYETRNALISLSQKYNFLILEDDVHAGLSFSGQQPKSLFSLLPDRVMYVGSISNLAGPGLRLGWIVASKPIMELLLKLKRDGGTNSLASNIVSYLIEHIQWDMYLKKLQDHYYHKMKATVSGLESLDPKLCSWVEPKGGFHLWVNLNKTINLDNFISICKSNNILLMPGSYCTGDTNLSLHSFRMSYSQLESDKIIFGTEMINSILKQLDKGSLVSQT